MTCSVTFLDALPNAFTFCIYGMKDHDATMPNYSVKDQHCDLPRGTFHQEIFAFSNKCEVPWYAQLFSPQEQVFSTESCFSGFKLDYCVAGPCPTSDDAVENSHNVWPLLVQ